MSIKDLLYRVIAETVVREEVYDYKKDIAMEVEENYKVKLNESKRKIKIQQNIISTLVKENQYLKQSLDMGTEAYIRKTNAEQCQLL